MQNETEIQVTISLGPKELTVANVVGLDEMSAKLELLKQGFLYSNIEVVEKYDPDAQPGMVLEQDPAYSEKVTAETYIKIYVNSYKGDELADGLMGNDGNYEDDSSDTSSDYTHD